jgi:hypothetical protein
MVDDTKDFVFQNLNKLCSSVLPVLLQRQDKESGTGTLRDMVTSSLSQEAEISQDLELSDYEQILREDLEDPDGHSEPPDDPPPEVADAPDYSEDPWFPFKSRAHFYLTVLYHGSHRRYIQVIHQMNFC